MTTAEQHRTDVKRKTSSTGGSFKQEYCVVCSCGYVSRWFDWRSDAVEDEAEHVRLCSA